MLTSNTRIVIAAAGLFALATGAATAAEMKAAGAFDGSITQQLAQPLGSADRLAVAELSKGKHATSGTPLDGADVLLSENLILDKGNGPQHGVITLAGDKGTMTNEIEGTVTTVMVDGQPHVTTKGTYKMLMGTGMFAGGHGHGTYKASFTSKTDYHAEYTGTLNLPKQEASR